MKNSSKLIFMSIAFVMFFSVVGVQESHAQLNQILKRMDAHKKALSSLKANIQMAKTDVLLDETDVTSGTVKYVPRKGRDAYVRIDWTNPVNESLAVANGQYVLYVPRRKEAFVGKTSEAGKGSSQNNLLRFMYMSKAELKRNFRMQYLGVEEVKSNKMWHLRLFPKTKASFKIADLWVDKDGMPRQVKITEKNDDTSVILLSNIDKNKSIKAKDFKVSLPKGTKIIR